MSKENTVEVSKDSDVKLRGAQYRDKGKFYRKSILRWKENIAVANKKRHIDVISLPAFSIDDRRIVEIEKLATDMWCKPCDRPIPFRNLTNETHHGLASVFSVRCTECNAIVRVHSSKQDENESVRSDYHVNSKAAISNYLSQFVQLIN